MSTCLSCSGILSTKISAFTGGIYGGGFIAGKRKGTQYGTNVNQKIDNIKFLDVGLVVGLDYKLKNHLLVGARYNFGVTNIYKNKDHMTGFDDYEYEYAYEYTLHNRILQLYLSIPLLFNVEL